MRPGTQNNKCRDGRISGVTPETGIYKRLAAQRKGLTVDGLREAVDGIHKPSTHISFSFIFLAPHKRQVNDNAGLERK
jgi:hypothetical protein